MPDFSRGDDVKHKASGELATVLRKFVECSAPDHVLTGPDGARVYLCQMTKTDGTPAVTTPDVWAADGYEVRTGFGETHTCYADEVEAAGPVTPPSPPAVATPAWRHGEMTIGVTPAVGPVPTGSTNTVGPTLAGAPPGDTRIQAVLVTMTPTGQRQVLLRKWFESRTWAEKWCTEMNTVVNDEGTFATLAEVLG